jgi:hypothetical protein
MRKVGFQTGGMDTLFMFFFALRKKKNEPALILSLREDIIAGVSSQDNMIAGVGKMEIFFVYHVLIID